MSNSLIHTMHRVPTFMRSISAMVMITFTMLILTPTVVAAKTELNKAPQASANKVKSAESQLSKTLQQVEQRLQKIAYKIEQQQATTTDIPKLQGLQQQLVNLDTKVIANFQKIKTELLDRQLPQVILDRHQHAVELYQKEISLLLSELKAIANANNDNERQNLVQKAIAHLKEKRNKRTPQPIDPKNLPFHASENKIRPPKETKEELEQIIGLNRPVQVASLELTSAMLAQASPSLTPINEDLLPTEDVQITDEIKALATQLEHHPVKIYNWVHNNIEYLPTYGSIQGSQMTLDNKRGNAFDTASLLIALLRASNISARYAYGTVQIPIEKVMNWVGGVESPNAALELMGKGGIPIAAITQGGVIKYAKLEHIWVEAWVDYMPSRGAINKTGDSWVSMDASFKQYQITQGMDLKNAVPFDGQGLIDQITQTAQINELDNSITGIDQNLIETALDDYRTQIKTYIEQTKTNATVGDVLGTKNIQTGEYPILVSGLPYKRLQTTSNFAVLPEHLRHQIQFKFYASNTDKELDNSAFSYQTSLAKLSDQRISLAYEPATEADRAVIDTAFENYQSQFAAYLVNMTPTLKIEGQHIAGTASYQVGTEQILKVTIQTPWYSQSKNYSFISGDVGVIGVNTAGTTLELYEKRIQSHDLNNTELPDYTAEIFHQILLGYWAELKAFKDVIAKTDDIRYNQLPSHGFAGAPVSVLYSFGIPRWASYKSRVLDIKGIHTSAIHSQNEASKKKYFMLKAGLLSSSLESSILDQAFLLKPGYSMSAVIVIQKANEQSIPIYQITDANLATVLPKLTIDTGIKNQISNAVNAGLEVMVPQDTITVAGFSGVGYIIIDPQTGSGSYLLNGYRDGGDSPTLEAPYPLEQTPSEITEDMVLNLLETATVYPKTENGIVTAVGLSSVVAGGAGAGAAATATGWGILLMIVAILLGDLYLSRVNKKFPKKAFPTIFRKYAKKWVSLINYAARWIQESNNPKFSFGSRVVYLTLHEDDDKALREILQFIGSTTVHCPPSYLQTFALAGAYQLPDPDSVPVPRMAESYIDIRVTRHNILKYDTNKNDNGVTEITVYRPLARFSSSPLRALHFGPGAIGLELDRDCIF